MTHPFVLQLILSFLLMSFLGMEANAMNSADSQVGSISELVKLFDSTSCKECHKEIFDQWSKSHHARPLMGLDDQIFLKKYLKTGPLAVTDLNQVTNRSIPCFKCHLPQIRYASDAAVVEIVSAILDDNKETIRKLNIGCLVCHNEKGIVRGKPATNTLYGNKDIPDHPEFPVHKSGLLKDSLMCGQCHGLGPVLDYEHPVQCATLYGSYLHAYIPAGGTETCQECHMPDKNHYMPPNFNNRQEVSELLAKALTLDVKTLAYVFEPVEDWATPKIIVRTTITSVAGHRIPDG